MKVWAISWRNSAGSMLARLGATPSGARAVQ
jgi:hypothetical protein